jgi:porin
MGKFNNMTTASTTPLVGGGGIVTFMNRAFAIPSTGVAYTSVKGGPEDRVVLAAPYTLGTKVTIKDDPLTVNLVVADPRSAIDPRVIEHPFEKGVSINASATLETKIAGLQGYHTIMGNYSTARGVDLEDISSFNIRTLDLSSPLTKKGYWVASYSVQQYLYQKKDNPKIGWGLFTLGTLSDGNPNPIKWTVFFGLAGNNLYPKRESDRWGIGFYHFGVSEALLSGLAQLGYQRQSEGGVEAFYNLAITSWCYLTADIQVIQPWNTTKQQEQIFALRLQTKF